MINKYDEELETNVDIDTVITDRVKTACNAHLRSLLSDALSEPDGKKRVLTIKIEMYSDQMNIDKAKTKVSVKAKLPEADPDEFEMNLDFTGQGNLFLVK